MRRILVLVVVGMLCSSAHAGVDPTAACKDAKAKAAARKASTLMKALGKNLSKNPDDRLASNVSKAQSRFTKAFEKAESKGECATTGDAGTVEAKVDAFVADVIAEVSPPPGCGLRQGGFVCEGECPPGTLCLYDSSGCACRSEGEQCQDDGVCGGLCPNPLFHCSDLPVPPCVCRLG